MHCGYVVKVEHIRPHTNADRLQIATFFGNDTVVDSKVFVGDVGVYFPVDLQLSTEYCEHNNLVRKKDDAGNNIGGFLDPDKRNIRAIKLRGEKSDGLYMPLETLSPFGDINTLSVGDTITNFNGHEICCKYIPSKQHRQGGYSEGNRTRKKKVPVAPLFAEHADTEQLAYNLAAFRPGDEIEITLKMHGTSQRTGYLPTLKGYADSWHCNLRNWLWFNFNRITHKNDLHATLDKFKHDGEPIYDWGYVSGTRRTVLEDFEGGYYGSNAFREAHSKFFEGKLNKGESVYYEVVGFTNTGAPIMGNGDNKKLNDKDFVKQYGDTTVFSYGCSPEDKKIEEVESEKWGKGFSINYMIQSDIYVYRMTMTNEDGFVVEYTPDFMRYRCEQIGVKTVPVFWNGKISEKHLVLYGDNDEIIHEYTAGEWVKCLAEQFYDGPDPIGKTHIREGVVVRIINRPKFCAYKHKNWYFKALEGIVKVEAEAPDMEEGDGLEKEA